MPAASAIRRASGERMPSWSHSAGAPTATASSATASQNSALIILRAMADTALAEIARWRADVAGLVTACCKEWDLRAGAPYVPGVCGHVVRVELTDGAPAVLKVWWPHREAEQEADALERWAADGAVRVLARDDERCALLLERCEPGAFLSTADDPLTVFVDLLPRLWRS